MKNQRLGIDGAGRRTSPLAPILLKELFMMRMLCSSEVDLPSSFPIRYSCQLGNLIPLEIQPVYEKGYPFEELFSGIGWVQHIWELGDRDKELTQLFRPEKFDLSVKGAPCPFTAPAGQAGLSKRP